MSTSSLISTESFFKKCAKKIKLEESRKALLCEIAETISKEYHKNGVVNLNFICTHNSRRSQFAQVWAHYAADFFNLNIRSFSGGTAVTSFYRNTLKTLQKSGFDFNIESFSHQNPIYSISYFGCKKTLLGYSKRFDDTENSTPYIAITTCNNADKNCPFVPEAIHRFHVPYTDPKHSDDSAFWQEVYLTTSEQIAAEIYFIFNNIKKY
ncbi:hypothetical protein [Polaribacter tangerinus]|uniref:hypothetical protein n=1 Tax=Polaribacter tangerinus TaxID=1920034 RepID=UPI000B4B0E34|nr:hypothetical protein [Polaribacter tangerinus]